MMKIILLLGLMSAVVSSSLAQDASTQDPSVKNKPREEKPAYAVSFVVVGARSDAYWTGDGPDMKVRAIDPGAAPPKDIFIALHKKKGSGSSSDKKKRQRLMLALNVPTDRIKLHSNVCNLSARIQSGEDTSYKSFTSVTLPKKIDPYTVFLARQPKRKTWNSPQQVVLSDSIARFPLGSARVVNMSDRPVIIQRGKKLVGVLKPGKSATLKKALKPKQADPIMLIYKDKGRKQITFRRALNYPEDKRINIVCSYAPKRSKPLLSHLFVSSEPLPSPTPPKKKSGIINQQSAP